LAHIEYDKLERTACLHQNLLCNGGENATEIFKMLFIFLW